MFYLTTHSTHFMVIWRQGKGRKQICIFNDIHFSYGYMASDMVKDYSISKRGIPLPPLHGILYPISSKGSFICTIPQTG